jgi:hypothetical protein
MRRKRILSKFVYDNEEEVIKPVLPHLPIDPIIKPVVVQEPTEQSDIAVSDSDTQYKSNIH